MTDSEQRGAIPPHTTPMADVDAAWDGAAAVREAEGKAELRAISAWVDDEGDADAKSSYKLPHHRDGKVVWRGVSAAMGRLMQAGTQIPDGDRRGVYNHLARHYRQFDKEPPDFRSAPPAEWRTFDLHVRASAEGGDEPRIEGYAAVFNSPSETLTEWGVTFVESIARGAFKKTLSDGADVRALVNHNPDYVLGRTKAGSLTLAEDRKGLKVDVQPPDTVWARDLMVSMRRGDLDQMSFAFRVLRDKWTEDKTLKTVHRELLEVQLYDVSVVTFPAYPATSAVVRMALGELGIDPGDLTSALLRMHAGLPPACEDAACLRSASEALREHIPAAPALPVGEGHPAADLLRRKLDLMALEI